MCVTNTTQRRPVTLSASQLTSKPSELSQRICSSLFLGTALPTTTSTTSTVVVKKEQPTPTTTETTTAAVKKPRKRRQQKPGKTAKMNDRHFVVHNYHDHAHDLDLDVAHEEGKRRRGGVSVAFPMKLHAMLDQIEQDGLAHVVSWQPHGRCFVVHKPKQFVESVLPKYFKQTKMTSFQRQLNLYGFQRLTRGHDASGYYHELFLRGKTFLCKQMSRTKVKGTGFKAASSPDQEPDFWHMEPVNAVTPPHVSEDDTSTTHSESTTTSDQQQRHQDFVVPTFSPVQPASSSSAVRPSSSIPIFFSMPTVPPTSSSPLPFGDMSMEPIPLNSQQQQYQHVSSSSDSDSEVLDEVVDELFLHESSPEENDNILDFVNTWNPQQHHPPHTVDLLQEDIQDDIQLGLLLERILDE